MIPRELFRKIRRVEVRTRGLVESVFGGEYHSAFRGRGIEFAEVRPYLVGDDVRTIDWNVSARTGEPYVKLFEEEREQTLVLVVDVSGSEDFGSGESAKRDLAAEVCAVLGFSALRQRRPRRPRPVHRLGRALRAAVEGQAPRAARAPRPLRARSQRAAGQTSPGRSTTCCASCAAARSWSS